MLFDQTHPEDVKAAIRKEYGSLRAFHQEKGLAANAVTELLRGRTSARTLEAVEAVLQGRGSRSKRLDSSSRNRGFHRKNAGRI